MRTGWSGTALLALLAPLAVAEPARAQDGGTLTITGRVSIADGPPLEGANVFIAEAGISVGTNEAGRYAIVVRGDRLRGQQATLRVRAVGYRPQTRALALRPGAQNFDFALERDINRLSEVVVTGVAGATEQSKVPFTVSRVDVADLPVPATNPLTQLQGRVPGANVLSASGRPGEGPQVQLRTPTSINAEGRGLQPLYIVDGIIVNSDSSLGGGLADLSALDIESIEIVKGAAASSLYGARAGAGVIQITTKSGRGARREGVSFNVRSEIGASDIEHSIPLAQRHTYLMTPDQSKFCLDRGCAQTFNFADTALALSQSGGVNGGKISALPLTGTTVWNTFQNNPWPGPTYDPVEQAVQTAPFSQTTADITGRVAGTSFYASAGNLTQRSPFRFLDGYARNSIRLNVDQQFPNELSLAFRSYYAHNRSDGQDAASTNALGNNALFSLTRMPIGVSLLARDTLGRLILRPDVTRPNGNPLYDLESRRRDAEGDRFLGAVTARYAPIEWFDVEGNFSVDRANNADHLFQDKGYRTPDANQVPNSGIITRVGQTFQSINTSLRATARRRLAPDLNARLQLQYLYEQQDNQGQAFVGFNLAVQGIGEGQNVGAQGIAVTSFDQSIRGIGAFAIADVDYKDRYILQGVIRRDGSSLFGPENRWATFGRASAAYVVSREPWWFVPQVNDLKLRYSYGTAGNRPNFDAQYETFGLASGNVGSPLTLGNAKLGPELVTEREMGLDAELFRRVGVTLTYARSETRDQILKVPLAASTGFGFQWQNAGTLSGRTWEASLNVPILTGPRHQLSTRVIYDASRATITALDAPAFQYGVAEQNLQGIFFARAGERLGTIYGTRYYTDLSQLPASVTAEQRAQLARNSDGYLVYVGTGNGVNDGRTKALWGTTAPFAISGNRPLWGAPIVERDATGQPLVQALGNTLPKYRLGWSADYTVGRFHAYGLVDGSFGRKLYNFGRQWSYFENYSSDQDQTDPDPNRWKPVGYYGAVYQTLAPNSAFIEDASFVKVRELSLGYTLGRLRGIGGDWQVSLIGRNLKTFTDYTGFDPETGAGGGNTASGILNGVDAFRFPNPRTFTLAIQTRF